MPKKITKEDVEDWLKINRPEIILLRWSGKGSLKSSFKDQKRNVEFEYCFSNMKSEHIRNSNILYGASPEEIKKKKCKSMTPEKRKVAAQKAKQIFLKKYGVDNPNKTKEIRDKIENTNLERYETKAPAQNKMIQQKIKNTNLERYGGHPMYLEEIKDKIKNTNLERYGVEHSLQREEIRQKMQQTILKKFGVENVSKLKEIKDKKIETCLKNHKVPTVLNLPEIKQKAIQKLLTKEVRDKRSKTNTERYGGENPHCSQEIRNKAIKTKIRTGLIKTINGKTLKEIAKEKGCGKSVLLKIFHKAGPEAVLKYTLKQTYIEQRVSEFLSSLNIQFYCNNGINGGLYRPDFIIPEHKLIIECDGLYWHSDAVQKFNNYHKLKKETYKNLGYDSLFFRENEIRMKFSTVESIILNKLKKSNKIYARKCEIREINRNIGYVFLEMNHLMGHGKGRCYGLHYNNELVGIMQVRWKNKKEKLLEVARFCLKNRLSIVGGWSKLINYICKIEQPKKIITFVDKRYGTGNYLLKLGWRITSEYISFCWTNFEDVFHRMNFRGNSGYEHGLVKIWDCGQTKYECLRK